MNNHSAVAVTGATGVLGGHVSHCLRPPRRAEGADLAWRDGTTHLVMSPLEFMQRLAAGATEGRPSGARAAVPRPRLHLIRFGVR